MSPAGRERALFALAVAIALALGLWVHWPSLRSGLRGDDYPQRAMLRGEFPSPRSPLDLFDFSSGDPHDVQRLIDFGYLPWWTLPDLRLRMWRPLASGLIAFDHRVFGDDYPLHHAHSLFWWAVVVIAGARVLRRLLPLSAAAIATLLFALEEGHTVPVGWLANRSTLVATGLAFVAFELHLIARSSPARPPGTRLALALATALFTSLALLAGEYAFTALGYIVAYELFRGGGGEAPASDRPRRGPEPIRARIRATAPVWLPAIAYLGLHTLVGSDIVGSGFYLSPLREPLAYARAATLRIPALFADLLLALPAEWFNGSGPLRLFFLDLDVFSPAWWSRMPSWPVWHAGIGYLAFGTGFWILRLCLRHAPAERRHGLQALALGSVLALLPAAGSLPGDRLVVAAALGVAGVAASLLVYAWPLLIPSGRAASLTGAPRRRVQLASALASTLILILPGWFGAERVYDQVRGYAWNAEGMRLWSLAAELPEQHAADTRVYVLATADFTTAANLPWVRLAHGRPLPRSYRRMIPATAPIDVARTGANTLDVLVLSSDVSGSAAPSLYRLAEAHMFAGQQVHMRGLVVTVLQVRDGNPAFVRFEFDRPVDDPMLWFVESSPQGVRRVEMPKLGERLRLPRPHYHDPRVPLAIE